MREGHARVYATDTMYIARNYLFRPGELLLVRRGDGDRDRLLDLRLRLLGDGDRRRVSIPRIK